MESKLLNSSICDLQRRLFRITSSQAIVTRANRRKPLYWRKSHEIMILAMVGLMTAAPAIARMTTREVTAQVIFGGHEIIEQCADAWRELCDESRCPPFFRPE